MNFRMLPSTASTSPGPGAGDPSGHFEASDDRGGTGEKYLLVRRGLPSDQRGHRSLRYSGGFKLISLNFVLELNEISTTQSKVKFQIQFNFCE